MIKAIVQKYMKLLESKAAFFVGYLLGFPIVLVVLNSMPEKMAFDTSLYFTVVIWTLIFFLMPIINSISGLLLLIQSLWFFSLAAQLPYYYKDGLESLLPGSTKWASFIYEKLGGDLYGNFIYWVRSFVTGKSIEMIQVYYYTFVVLIIVIVMAIVHDLIKKRVNWKIFLAIGSYFVLAWFIYVTKLRLYFSIYFIGVTAYKQFMVYESVVEEAKGKGERTRYYNYNSAMVMGSVIMSIIIVVSTLVTNFIPVEEINFKIDQYIPSIGGMRSDYASNRIGGSSTFSFSRTMYAPNGKLLGGPIMTRDYSVVMTAKSEVGGLYLRGRVKNDYDGKQWTSDFSTYRNNQFVGDLYTPLPIAEVAELIIYPKRISTRTLFSPYLYYLSEYDRGDVYGNVDKIVYIKDDVAAEFSRYKILYVKEEFLGKYDKLREDLRSSYLKYPDKGLDKTKNLTKTVLEGIDDPKEKMETLVDYLRENYRYTLNTQAPDYEKDFVERFLFEEQLGYCTYFASSLAIMGRIADVPTRYVEGYIMNDFTNSDGLYEITANRAHAWVEAYIEGEGWLRFESTPAYSVNSNAAQEEEEEYELSSDVEREDNLDVEPVEPLDFDTGNNKVSLLNYQLGLTIAFYVLILLMISYMIYSKLKRIKLDKTTGNYSEKINRRVAYMLSMASLVDNDFEFSELPKHIIERISDAYLNIIVPPQISKMIDQSLYSLHEFNEEEYQEFEIFFEEYEEEVRLQIGKITYFAHKYIFNTLYHKDYYE